MLTRPQVQRYTAESGLRDIMIAEKEIILTYLLQLMAERGILDKLAFKGGTCLRKMFIGTGGRFSTDLDFTGLEEHDHEDIVLEMMAAFEQPVIRRLVVLKLWQAGDSFDPAALMQKFEDGTAFGWDDLGQLVRRTQEINPDRITADCVNGFAFLGELTPEERALASDPYQREHALWQRLRDELTDR